MIRVGNRSGTGLHFVLVGHKLAVRVHPLRPPWVVPRGAINTRFHGPVLVPRITVDGSRRVEGKVGGIVAKGRSGIAIAIARSAGDSGVKGGTG